MTQRPNLSTRASDGNSLGVLSVHLDGGRCRVGCEYCYLGARTDAGGQAPDLALLSSLLERLPYDELAVAVSEPAEAARDGLAVIRAAAAARRRPLAVTTTLSLAAAHPEVLDGAARVNLSVDPRKGAVLPARIGAFARALKAARPLEVILIVSVVTPEFAARLTDGLLAELVDLPDVDRVAWNALKPPPPWCDRAFWLRALARLQPLLERALDRRLFLDCYVAARIVGLGGCPGRADLSPAPGGFAFRSCVYQPAPERIAGDADRLASEVGGFVPPAACPFEIR
jgi:hypothetical protein